MGGGRRGGEGEAIGGVKVLIDDGVGGGIGGMLNDPALERAEDGIPD